MTGTPNILYTHRDVYDRLRVQPRKRRAAHVFYGLDIHTDGSHET